MRKKLIIAIIFVLNIFVLGQSNILLNSDFENGSENWEAKNCEIAAVDTLAESGSQSLKIFNRTKVFSGAYQTILDSLRYNGYGRYIVQAFYKTESGEDTAKIKIRYTVDGQRHNVIVKSYINNQNWSEVLDTVTLDWENANLTNAEIFFQTQNDISLSYFIDNLSLIPYEVSGGIRDTVGGEDSLDTPISPEDYAAALGKGFDVNWVKSASQAGYYSVELLQQIKERGFKHIRLRTNLESPTEFINISCPIVQDCLDNDMYPIISFGGHMLEENPDSTNIANFVNWWRTVAQFYKNYSHRVTFDLLIEISGQLADEPETLNDIYEQTVAAIRESNPTRIVFLSPRKLSNPFYLHELRIPSTANGYLMWEWHFYAGGPSRTNRTKLWTTGTPEERKLITDKVDSALAWVERTGFPSWVGAWMPSNYNGGNDYTVPEQTVFASFLTRQLDNANVPFALNAIQQFNNYLDGTIEWKQELRPVLDAVLDPNKVTFYEEVDYGGNSTKLPLGEYNKDALEGLGLVSNIQSIMIPADVKVHFYEGENFDGGERVDSMTSPNVFAEPFNFQSIKIKSDSVLTSVGEEIKPSEFRLYQNYPNPFNPTTNITYVIADLNKNGERNSNGSINVSLKVYDLLGREVATLVNKKQKPGKYSVQFNTSSASIDLPSGVYFYSLRAGTFIQTKKMLLLK